MSIPYTMLLNFITALWELICELLNCFHGLLDKKSRPSRLLNSFDSVTDNGVEDVKPLPLYAYEEVYASLGTFPIADFVIGISGHYYGRLGEKFNFRKHKTVSLLSTGLLYGHLETIHIRFLPLDFVLKENAQIILTFKLNNKLVQVPIGVGGRQIRGYRQLADGEV